MHNTHSILLGLCLTPQVLFFDPSYTIAFFPLFGCLFYFIMLGLFTQEKGGGGCGLGGLQKNNLKNRLACSAAVLVVVVAATCSACLPALACSPWQAGNRKTGTKRRPAKLGGLRLWLW